MMREKFDKKLADLRRELVSIYTAIDLVLHDAVDALLAQDGKASKAIIQKTQDLDARCAELEDSAYNQIVLQNPVASDLRLLQFIVYAVFNMERMSSHTRNIARTARRVEGELVTKDLIDLLDAEAHLVFRVLGASVRCVVENDLAEASSLPELDSPVNQLYKSFYRNFSRLKKASEIEAASKLMIAGRMLERIADNAVEIGERLVFLLTGERTRLSELATLNDEELEEMYVSQAPSFTMEAKKIQYLANQIPEMDVTVAEQAEGHLPNFAESIAHALDLAKKMSKEGTQSPSENNVGKKPEKASQKTTSTKRAKEKK